MEPANKRRRLAASVRVEYKNITFDSILEAQHAVFLDALGCSWKPQAPKVKDIRDTGGVYTPDFMVSGLCGGNVVLEVKPKEPPQEACRLMRRLSEKLPWTRCIILFGDFTHGTGIKDKHTGGYSFSYAHGIRGQVYLNGLLLPGVVVWGWNTQNRQPELVHILPDIEVPQCIDFSAEPLQAAYTQAVHHRQLFRRV